MKVLMKKVGQPVEVREVEATYRCDCKSLILQPGDLIEYTDLVEFYKAKDHSVMCVMVDEEGMMKDLSANVLLPTVKGIEPMLGDIVIMRYVPENVWEKDIWDFKLAPLTDFDISYLKKLLDTDSEFQKAIDQFL